MENKERLDPLSPTERSERMSRIRQCDTKPEMLVRRLVFGMGFRYRLYDKRIPGHPDLVFNSRKKLIFVHGCFWHQHGCNHYRMPKTRTEFWEKKLWNNVERDEKVQITLRDLGWETMIIWECELKDIDLLRKRIVSFLG